MGFWDFILGRDVEERHEKQLRDMTKDRLGSSSPSEISEEISRQESIARGKWQECRDKHGMGDYKGYVDAKYEAADAEVQKGEAKRIFDEKIQEMVDKKVNEALKEKKP